MTMFASALFASAGPSLVLALALLLGVVAELDRLRRCGPPGDRDADAA